MQVLRKHAECFHHLHNFVSDFVFLIRFATGKKTLRDKKAVSLRLPTMKAWLSVSVEMDRKCGSTGHRNSDPTA